MPISIGEIISHYRILNRLGAGGMGVVYVAEDVTLGRLVAIKFPSDDLAHTPAARERFLREARAASALNHPNICTVHEAGEADGRLYIVMELLQGDTLDRQLAGRPLPLERLLQLAIQIADALDAAHATGIVHRDVKASNILVMGEDRVKVLDFGLAKLAGGDAGDGPASETAVTAASLTTVGAALGTPAYMSPEQVRGESVDARSDVFSFGALLYQMATGRMPFPGDTAGVIAAGILEKQPVPADRVNPEVPAGLAQIIAKALEKDVALRYRRVADLRADLKKLHRAPTTQLRPAISPRPPLPRGRRALLAAALGTALAAGVLYFGFSTGPESIDSVAVLPFARGTGGEDIEYVSDGLTDTLINRLSRVRTLRVVPRTLVATYTGDRVDVQQAARDLNVRAVVTGSVRQRGEMLTVQAAMIDARRASQLWGDHYTRPITDMLAVQEEISRAIVDSLQMTLSSEDATRLERQPTTSSAAYELYLRGRHHWKKRSDHDVRTAIDYFERAIQTDSKYALAHAGLADAYLMAFYMPATAMLPQAKAAALRAIELDPGLAEAHTTLALVMHSYDQDWEAAGEVFRRALALNPSYATAHHWYGLYLAHMKQLDEGINEVRTAMRLDPLSVGIAADLVQLLMFARRYEAAEDAVREVRQLDPGFSRARRFHATLLTLTGRHAEAIAELQDALDASNPPNTQLLAALGHAYAAAGRHADARDVLGRLQALRKERYVSPVDTAIVFAGIGQREEALSWLEKGIEDRAIWHAWLDLDPRFDAIRPDPRFQRLQRHLGLPE